MGTKSERPRTACRLRAEWLEGRDCPSVSALVDGTTLRVRGDDGANGIAVIDRGPDGVAVGFDKAQPTTYKGITAVSVTAGGGNDSVQVVLSGGPSKLAVNVDLGAGDDNLQVLLQPSQPAGSGGTGGSTGTGGTGGATGSGGSTGGTGGSTGGTGGTTGTPGGTVINPGVTKTSTGGTTYSTGGTGTGTAGTGGTGTGVAGGTGTGTPPSTGSVTPPPIGSVQVTVVGGDGNDALMLVGVAPPPSPGAKPPAIGADLSVSFDGGAGNDRIGALLGGMAFPGKVGLTLLGGAGADAIGVQGTSVGFSAPVGITARGGAGNDVVRVGFDAGPDGKLPFQLPPAPDGKAPPAEAKGPPSRFGGAVQLQVSGDDGDDDLAVFLGGVPVTAGKTTTPPAGPTVCGPLDITVDGGIGSDRIGVRVAVDPAGPGKVGAKLVGGDGNDTLGLDFGAVPDKVRAYATVDGGVGTDSARAAGKVDVTGVETIVPPGPAKKTA